MVRKKVEGNEEQRRAAAHEAHRAGESPSAWASTTGASKQPTHMGAHEGSHEEKLAAQHRGKARWRASDLAEEELRDPAAEEPARTYHGRAKPEYDERHEQVFRALASAEEEHGGRSVRVTEVSRKAGMGKAETRDVLHDLATEQGLAAELQDPGDGFGPSYETKPRR